MATSFWELMGEYKIEIPILQRDYAQGRQIGKVPLVRERFLNSLFAAITTDAAPLELDFIYGYTKENQNGSSKTTKSFIPLDGQQRLTTLFLLHWFVAVKEKHLDEAETVLSKFTYETRHSSRVFCEELVKFQPEDFEVPVRETIINEPWFFTAWKHDPTIDSMLTMLNALQEKFQKVDGIWPLLTQGQARIGFHLLPMENLGLPDDLYIKMNSRGKELSEFEHFKSRFSEILHDDQASTFNQKIDQAWSDLFWDLYKNEGIGDIAKRADNAFLRFFRYVTDLLIARNDITLELQSDDLETYRKIYQNPENVDFLFSCLEAFTKSYKINSDFFDSVFYVEDSDFKEERTRLFFQNASTDLFKKCADHYDTSPRQNPFSIGEQLLLYACMLHLTHDTSSFSRRIRTLRNLITNSEDTVRKENMPSLLETVSELIINNKIDNDSKFNKTQIKEEEEKQLFIEEKTGFKETLYKLEDHQLLQGCIALFRLDDDLHDYAATFHRVFTTNCDYDIISRALLIFGNYSQKYDTWRWRFGNHNNSVWRELFTPSQRRAEFQRTRDVVYSLISNLILNPESTLENIISDYLAQFEHEVGKPKEWRFYFIKYPDFRKNEDGFYTWLPKFDKPYECLMMRRTTLGGFHWSPFLYALTMKFKNQLSMDNYGAPMFLTKGSSTLKISNINNGYRFESADDESKALLLKLRELNYLNDEGLFQISQNHEGLDKEDRVAKCVELISEILGNV